MNILDSQTTVGQLVAARPAWARTFERLGIDYCCGGRLSLKEACAKRGLNPEQVAQELRTQENPVGAPDERVWSQAPAAELADHIESTHHSYLRRELPRLAQLTAKVAAAHGSHHRGLIELRNVFEKFACELNAHMLKEERVLFPIIRRLERGGAPGARGVGRPISAMILEHDDAGEALSLMRALTDDFTPPHDACGAYLAMLDGLRELELDMHAHVHKENNILFPAALRLEAIARGDAPGSCGCDTGPGAKEDES